MAGIAPFERPGAGEPMAILVNGLPGAGKTTLARAVSRRIRLPLLSKDVIKEAHAGFFGAEPPDGRPQRQWNRAFGAAASETMWALLADAPGGAPDRPLPGAACRHLGSGRRRERRRVDRRAGAAFRVR